MTARLQDLTRDQHPFTLLSTDERERIQAMAQSREFRGGERILRQGGATSTCLYVVASGEARLTLDGQDLDLFEEGDLFGYPSMISGNPPCCDVVARGRVTVHCIPKTTFDELMANPAFGDFFRQSLGERLQQLQTGARSLGSELTTELRDLVSKQPVMLPASATAADAARAMRDARTDAALTLAETDGSVGILTDHDFQTRLLAEDLPPETPIERIATVPVKTLPADTPVHAALLYMLEHRIHHLPVTAGGDITGIVSASDLLRHQSRNPLYLMQKLERIEDSAALASYPDEAATMVERLFAGGLMVGQIGRIFASLNDALIRRLCRLAEDELGPPPCSYAWLVFGSEGRMEQALLTDQDNALAYEQDTPEAKEYFARLAEFVVDRLVKAGFPPCPGGCMATNWNQPIDRWRATIREWIDEPTPDNLMVSSIFFDFRAVAGDLDTSPLADVVASAAESQLFMAHLARVSLRFKPPLGLLGRISAEDGKVDLKKRGIASIAAAARVWALEAGARARPSRDRIEAAIEAGVVSRDLGRNLIETYRFLLHLRLGSQLAALKAGRELDNHVSLAKLPSLERRHLKDAFGAIREMQQALKQRYQTDTLG